MGLFSSIASLLGLGYEVYKDQHLTGAQNEANAFTAQQNQLARDFSAQQSQAQMDFQERMANTQYQRGVEDLRAAGLNPALAYTNGGNVAPSGASASASGASSVDPGHGMTLSDILALAKIKSEVKLNEAQADELSAGAELKRSQKSGQDITNEWNPKVWASEIRLRESTESKLAAEVGSILATTEGQRIYNEFSPKLFESQLQSAEVDRNQMIASIAKMQAEIQHFTYENAGIAADIEYKRALQVLTAAQTALTNLQSQSVSADVWSKEFSNAFQEEFGTRPDLPIWNNVTGMLGKFARALDDGREATWNFIGSLFGKK